MKSLDCQSLPTLDLPPLSRRGVLSLAALAFTSLALADQASRKRLRPTEPYVIDRPGEGSVLQSFHPGMIADVAEQTEPLLETATRFGDVMQFGSNGDLLDPQVIAAYSAEALAKRLKSGKYDECVMTGISMGGRIAADTIDLIRGNRTDQDVSTELHLTLWDAPETGEDVKTPDRYGARIASRYPFGALANTLPVVSLIEPNASTPLSRWRDEVRAVIDRPPLTEGSIDVPSMAYVYGTMPGNVTLPGAREPWQRALAPGGRFLYVPIEAEHAGIVSSPQLAAGAYQQTIDFHLNRAA